MKRIAFGMTAGALVAGFLFCPAAASALDAIVVAPDGKVGIGVNPPSSALHIVSNVPGGVGVLVRNSSTSGYSGIEFAKSDGQAAFFFVPTSVPTIRRDQPEDSGHGRSLLIEAHMRVVPLHLLGDVPGQRPADHGVHVRPPHQIGERVPHPVHREPVADPGDLDAPPPGLVEAARRPQRPG